MSRAVPEWIGTSDDTPAPPRVRLRVFDRHGGICFLSGRKIMPGDKWELHHIKALILGGTNSEFNLAPVLADEHKKETARQMVAKAKIARTRAKHILPRPRSSLSHPTLRRTMSGQVVSRATGEPIRRT